MARPRRCNPVIPRARGAGSGLHFRVGKLLGQAGETGVSLQKQGQRELLRRRVLHKTLPGLWGASDFHGFAQKTPQTKASGRSAVSLPVFFYFLSHFLAFTHYFLSLCSRPALCLQRHDQDFGHLRRSFQSPLGDARPDLPIAKPHFAALLIYQVSLCSSPCCPGAVVVACADQRGLFSFHAGFCNALLQPRREQQDAREAIFLCRKVCASLSLLKSTWLPFCWKFLPKYDVIRWRK